VYYRIRAATAPLAFFICGAIGIGLLYEVIADREMQRIRLETEITAEQVRLRLEAWIDSRTALVEHLGTGHFADQADIERNFRHDAETFVDLYPGIQAMNFIDRNWVIRKIVPAETNAPALDQDLHNHPNASVVAALQKSEEIQQLTGTTLIELLQGGEGFATYHPLLTRGGAALGFVNGVYRIRELIDACLYEPVLRNRFSFRLVDDAGNMAYVHERSPVPPAGQWQVTAYVRVVDRSWLLYLTPDSAYLARTRTLADEVMAVVGVLLIAGLALLLRLLLVRKEALRQSQAKYRLLVENQIDLVVQLDPAGRFRYASPSFCETVGRSEAELIGTSFLPLIHTDDRDESQATLQEVERPPHRSYTEHRALTRDGVAWQAWTSVAVFNSAGALEAINAVGRDITRRRELEDQLLFSRKMQAVGQLAGGIAHDFNNLLQAMLGNLQFVVEDMQPSGQTAEDLREIEKGIGKAISLTQKLLAFSHKQELRPQRADLSAVVESTLEEVRRSLRSAISLEFTAAEDPVAVRVDRGQIAQIVRNLCDNARDAITASGSITIATSIRELDPGFCAQQGDLEPGRYATLAVTDDGHGMSAEVLERVFEPFYTTREVGAGTGLGLATIYGIVQQHHGTILVTSTVDQGSCFTVLLPLEEDAESRMSRGVEFPDVGNRETILLAEDDVSVRELAVRVLERANYVVLAAEDGQQAIEVFAAHQDDIDLVMLDMVMPKADGREVHAAIVAMRPGVPVLFASGYDPATLEGEGLPADVQDILMKPYGIPELLRMIRRILDRDRQPDAGTRPGP
jgi:PAS domain S-box-containing protein